MSGKKDILMCHSDRTYCSVLLQKDLVVCFVGSTNMTGQKDHVVCQSKRTM